jgi:hypothetical protein
MAIPAGVSLDSIRAVYEVLAALVGDGGDTLTMGGEYNTTAPTLANGAQDALQLDSRGNLKASLWNGGGTDQIISVAVNVDNASPGSLANRLQIAALQYVFNGSGFDRMKKPNLNSRLLSAAATTNATSVKTSAGDLFKITGYNAAATPRYLKLYNKASAPTVGTDTPVHTIYLPASSRFTEAFDTPFYFSTGIAYAITGAGADADTTALTAADILAMNVSYA